VARFARDEQRRSAARGRYPAEPLDLEISGMLMTPLPAQIEALFLRHPSLCGFSVHGLDELPDNCPRSGDGDAELFIGEVGIAPPIGAEQCGEIVREIAAALAELLAEDPQANEILRGRTFARVLH
jgi:hypothetical protein